MKSIHPISLLLLPIIAITAFTPSPSKLPLNKQSVLREQEESITIDQYSRCLSPYQEKQSIKNESRQYAIIDARPQWQSNLLKPVKLLGEYSE